MKFKKENVVATGIVLVVATGISIAFDIVASKSGPEINFKPAAAERAAAEAILSYQAHTATYDCKVMGMPGTNVEVLYKNGSLNVCVGKAQYNSGNFNNMLGQGVFNDTPNTLVSYPVSFTTTIGKKSTSSSGYVADVGSGDLAIFVPNNNGTVYFIPAKMIDCWKNPFAAVKR